MSESARLRRANCSRTASNSPSTATAAAATTTTTVNDARAGHASTLVYCRRASPYSMLITLQAGFDVGYQRLAESTPGFTAPAGCQRCLRLLSHVYFSHNTALMSHLRRLHSGQTTRVFTYQSHALLMFCVYLFYFFVRYFFLLLTPPRSQIVTALTKGLVWGSCRRFAGMLVAGETDLKLCVTDGRSSALQ